LNACIYWPYSWKYCCAFIFEWIAKISHADLTIYCQSPTKFILNFSWYLIIWVSACYDIITANILDARYYVWACSQKNIWFCVLNTVESLCNKHFGTRYLKLTTFCCNINLSEVKNVLVTPVGTKIFVLIMEVFSIVSLIQRVY